MDITIRHARPEDIPQMCDLLSDLFTIESDFKPDRSKQVRGLELLVNDLMGGSFALVATIGDEVVGMCTVQTLISTAEGGHVGLVEDVIVRRDCREQGIGTELLYEAIAACKAKGLSRLHLLADKENKTAQDFYIDRRWSVTNLICLRKVL